jgi:hypothetical protein
VVATQSDQDILIGGWTDFDNDYTTLGLLQAEWTSNRSFVERTANLSGTGTGPRLNGSNFLISGSTVHDDREADKLIGASDRDLFFDGLDDKLISNQLDELFASEPDLLLDL